MIESFLEMSCFKDKFLKSIWNFHWSKILLQRYGFLAIFPFDLTNTTSTGWETLLFLQVYAIIVSKPSKGDLSPASVSYTAGFYHIPVIGISSRDSAFSDKARHIFN